MSHAFNWVEIPSTDFDRAVGFYSTVLNREIDVHTPEPDSESEPENTPDGKCGLFQTEDGAVGGMIVETDEYTTDSGASVSYTPTTDGLIVYLSVDGDLDDALDRVESASGEVLIPKESIPDGHYAIVTDSEGNRIGLMSEE